MSDSDKMKEQIGSLTVHGLSNVATAETWYSRFIWFCLCILAASTLAYTFVTSYSKYIGHEIYEKLELRQNQQMAFPAITFCHTDFYNPQLYLQIPPPVFQHFPRNCSFTSREHFKNTMNMYAFSIWCKVFIATFDGKSSAIGEIYPHFFSFPDGFTFLPNFYPCTTLNRNSTLVQNQTGEGHGINMILYGVDANYSVFNYEVESPLLERRQGIFLALHDPEQHVPFSDKILAPVGFHTHVFITKNIAKRLPTPYPSGCVQGGPDKGSMFPGKNTLNMCYMSCVHKSLYSICGGFLSDMMVFLEPTEYNKTRNISYNTLLRCMNRELTSIDLNSCNCKPHCFEETYSFTTNRYPWPSKRQISTLSKMVNKLEGVENRTLNLSDLRDRLAKVSISYETFKEVVHIEAPLYDFLSVASDVGGQMGLFLGASIISLIEILSLLIVYITRKIFKKSKAPSTVEIAEHSVKI